MNSTVTIKTHSFCIAVHGNTDIGPFIILVDVETFYNLVCKGLENDDIFDKFKMVSYLLDHQ